MKMREFFSGPEKWTRGAYFRDENNVMIGEYLPAIVCSCCLLGALRHCYQGAKMKLVYEKICNKIGTHIISWNDSKERTFDDVKNLVEALDI